MKDKVIIVEALSTGFNLVQDCLDRDLEPVILEVDYKEQEAYELNQLDREKNYRRLKSKILIIREDPSYEKTLEMVRALQPRLVIPGAEDGVILATRLADDLDLPGNPCSLIDKMTNKYHMHQALADAGIRHIRGKVVHSVEEAAQYYDDLGVEKVVVKPPHGAASMGVRFCDSREAVLRTFEEQHGQVNIFGERTDDLMIQERILGTEYIVNTITINGEHFVASIWEYDKRALPNGSNVYVGQKAIPTVTPIAYMLVKYAFSVLDAIGIKQGPVHGEYMMDDHGPVLMEINCRCMGPSYSIDYGNVTYGHHETDMQLDSYLNPDHVREMLSRPYGIKTYAIKKFLVTPENMPLANSPILGILPYLKSYHSATINTSAFTSLLLKTTDLETAAGTISLAHNDYAVVDYEYNLLCELERHYFGLIYQDAYDPALGALPEISDEAESKDLVTMDVRNLKNYPLEDVYQYIKDLVRTLKPGGMIKVPATTYQDFPYGAAGLIMLFRIMNFTISMPRQDDTDIIMHKS